MGSDVSTEAEPPKNLGERKLSRRTSHRLIVEKNNLRFKRRLSLLKGKDEIDASTTTDQPKQSANGFQAIALSSIAEDIDDVDFPYENLVLEGGGSQGNAYIGAIMELERLNFLSKIRRFAGSSIGSVTAAYLAVGHGSSKFLSIIKDGPQFEDLLDAPCGKCSLVPNLFKYMGWHPGRTAYQSIGEDIAEKLGDPNATFKDLYVKTGRELCVVVTNLTTMMEEYCHVKTTPNMPMRTAVRMSMSAPVVFVPVKRQYMGRTDLYIDGGILCNYPVHCFDGWWLSMKPEDALLKKMQPLEDAAKLLTKKERFGMFNDKTFGMIIYSDYDSHVLATNPDLEAPIAPIPDTKLARAHEKIKEKRELNCKQHRLVTDAMTRFLKVLDQNSIGGTTINIKAFKQVFNNNEEFTSDHARILFGEDMTVDEIFDSLDANSDGEIDFNELMSLAEVEGVGIQTHHIGTGRLDIKNLTDYLTGIFSMLLLNVKRAFLEGQDIERTVLINTVYVKSLDFSPETEDLDFLVEQGRRGVRTFLKYHNKAAKGEAS
ncbi:uncharacterized protein LOC584119 [Strongylocentrotus purpuratus]|uniref:Uncharacterized protein n=1 Tax=Strongylocentrotus purpuratus TaxID=7668 RepID=A0A7M7REB2_STRPU|nr:uncharacterized protein LOC584119 [Strongylocentrotus purpuratus]|eukprot:XP_789091.2 PREDICTED: uncharacterized protein LOC584119 [Strongylocentrotus purpuratus]